MQRIFEQIKERVAALLASGEVSRVIGWRKGEFFYDETPATFDAQTGLDEFVYDGFSAANLSKYLIGETRKDGKIAALLKPCDTYSFNQLVTEHRIDRAKVHVIGIPCKGKLDMEKIRARVRGITAVEESGDDVIVRSIYGDATLPRAEVLLERCLCCKGGEHKVADEVIEKDWDSTFVPENRFALVERLEAMTPDERFAFWQGELSRCIRCNACRNVCPACTCVKCVFDNDASGVAAKANTDSFEEKMFHIIRAFHVTGRCTDCGECSRVCPQGIPLHLLNRKFIKDIGEHYGAYQAGMEIGQRNPVVDYTEGDPEPSVVSDKGGNN